MSTTEQVTTAPSAEPEESSPGFWSGRTGQRILDAISFIARFYMSYVWISAGVVKLDDHMNMTQAIVAYEIFTPYWSDLLARLIGPLEVAGGVLLLLGVFLRRASRVAACVLVLFIVGIGQAWIRGLGIDCGCFSIKPNQDEQAMDYFFTILRDLGFLALTVWTIRRPFTRFAIHP